MQRVHTIFPNIPESDELIQRVQELLDQQIKRVIDESTVAVDKIDREIDQLWDEHENYEEHLVSDLFTREAFENTGETPPASILSEDEIFSRIDDPTSGTFRLQEKHEILLQKLLTESKSLGLKLSEIDTGLFIFLGAFKALFENGITVPFEDIRSSSFQELIGTEIPSEQTAEMRKIYESNQSANTAVQKELVGNFENSLRDGKTHFYVFTYQDHVQSFAAFTPITGDALKASAFNVAPSARGYKIGEAMLYEAIDTVAHEHTLIADCDSKLPISAKYIETGWVATRYWNDHGDNILDIVRNDHVRDSYPSKALRPEDIIAGRIPDGAVIHSAEKQTELPFALCNEGYVLTRMFFEPKTNRHYAVFEPVQPAHTKTGTDVDASRK